MAYKRFCTKFFSAWRRRTLFTSALTLESSLPSSSGDHSHSCILLAEKLIQCGSLSSAKKVIQRIIGICSSLPEAISVVNFARRHGINLEADSLIRELMDSGHPSVAETIFSDMVVERGIEPSISMLNLMVMCFCRLWKTDEAAAQFDRILAAKATPWAASCNLLLCELSAKQRVLDAFDYFVKISDLGVVLKFWTYNTLIVELCFRGHVDESLKVYDVMTIKAKCWPNEHVGRSLIYGLCRRDRVMEAETICRMMELRGVPVGKKIYTYLIYKYCKDRKMKMAMQLFIRILKLGFIPDSYMYNTLIYGFVKLGMVDKSWVVYSQMIGGGIEPDLVTHHLIMCEYCRKLNMDCAFALFRSMSPRGLPPTVHFYTALITALGEQGKLQEVEEVWKRMLENEVSPDHVLYFALIRQFPKGYELEICYMVLQALANVSCCMDSSLLHSLMNSGSSASFEEKIGILLEEMVERKPNLAYVALTTFICALCAVGNIEAALLGMEKMINFGFTPSVSTFNSLIKCLCHNGCLQDAKALIDVMQNSGVDATETTYLVIVHELCKQRDVDSALLVLEQMHERGLKPNVAIYDTIIDCLSNEKRILEASRIFSSMLEAGVSPDEVVYVTMINGYSKNGRALDARNLFEKMIEDGLESTCRAYTALINGLVRKNRTGEGCLYLDKMLEDGFLPNTVLYTALIKQFLRKGELEYAFKLLNLMETFQIELDMVSYIVLVSGVSRDIHLTWPKQHSHSERSAKEREELLYLLRQKTFLPQGDTLNILMTTSEERKRFVLKLMQEIKDASFGPNLYLYNSMIAGLLRADKTETARECLDMMVRQGMLPNQVTFTIFMNDHIKRNEIDEAIRIFNKMNADGTLDRISYNALLSGLCKAERLVDALSLLHAMYKRGLDPSMRSYENLLTSLCKHHLSNEAFWIYEEMLAHGLVPCLYNRNLLIYTLRADNKLSKARMLHNVGFSQKEDLIIYQASIY